MVDNCSSYTDFMCPICLQLLIQPVVMPCKHELCMPCFKANVEETSLRCPMCRVRISNWARKKAREGTLVDKARWSLIQKLFPERCEKRLRGEEDDDDLPVTGTEFTPIVAEDGVLRKEYEQELMKVELEKLEEIKASEEVVKKIQEEEQELEEKLREDENIAKQLQKQELERLGGKESQLDTKLVQLLDTYKLPKERTLRSNFANKNEIQSPGNSKGKTSLTCWLSKSNQESSGVSSENRPTKAMTRQEEADYKMAFKIQKELDVESRKRLDPITLNKHFYPLRHKTRIDDGTVSSKRLKTD